MKRTSPWIFVAAAALQFAALGLCLWAMEQRAVPLEPERAERSEEEPVPRRALAPAPPAVSADAAFARRPVDAVREPEPAVRPAPPPPAPPPPAPPAPEAREGPRFGPPPSRALQLSALADAPPPYITEIGDATTQIMRATVGERFVTFGLYADGNIRFVDVDGGRYSGRGDAGRARMRETDGTRAFTVQFGVTENGELRAGFTGGLHEGETLALSPLVGGSVA